MNTQETHNYARIIKIITSPPSLNENRSGEYPSLSRYKHSFVVKVLGDVSDTRHLCSLVDLPPPTFSKQEETITN
jgi:hypothetical protein